MEFSASSVTDSLANKPTLVVSGGLLVGLFLLNFLVTDADSVFALVPVNTLITKRYVWNLVTSCFYETNIGKLAFDFVALMWLVSQMAIGNMEQYLCFAGFSILSCSFGYEAYCFIRFFTSGNQDFLLTPVFGFHGLLIALSMYLRQQWKGQSVHPSAPFITFHHVPVLLLVAQVLAAVLRLSFLSKDLPFSIIAFFFSWSYLRFYYRYVEGEPLGDKSEDFSFVHMFPEVLHLILIPLSTAFYNILALVGLYPVLEVVEKKTFHHLRNPVDNQPAAEEPHVTTKVDLVAERRRAKALKLLDAKMAELSQEPEGWDDKGSSSPAPDDIEAVGSRNLPELSKLKV